MNHIHLVLKMWFLLVILCTIKNVHALPGPNKFPQIQKLSVTPLHNQNLNQQPLQSSYTQIDNGKDIQHSNSDGFQPKQTSVDNDHQFKGSNQYQELNVITDNQSSLMSNNSHIKQNNDPFGAAKSDHKQEPNNYQERNRDMGNYDQLNNSMNKQQTHPTGFQQQFIDTQQQNSSPDSAHKYEANFDSQTQFSNKLQFSNQPQLNNQPQFNNQQPHNSINHQQIPNSAGNYRNQFNNHPQNDQQPQFETPPNVSGPSKFLPSDFPKGSSMIPFTANQEPCPTPPVVNNFQVKQYAGRWFEIERFFAPFQNGDCVTADYSFFPNCSIAVVNSNMILGQLQSVFGNAVSGPDPSKGELIVSFPGQPGESMFRSDVPNYGIVATDYTNYAVVYSCTNISPTRRFEYSWILGRRERLNSEFLDHIKKWLKQMGIKVDRYMPTNQQNCLRRPEEASINANKRH